MSERVASAPVIDTLVVAATLAQTPLHALHVSLGARMVAFAGYDMPLHYPSGIIAEHLHTRAAAGLFDVSHMGQAILTGPNAAARLETLVPGDLESLTPGRMRYTQLLDTKGNILDDLMVTRLPQEGSDEQLYLVVNAGTKSADFAHIASKLPDLTLTPLEHHALLALQGPQAASGLIRFFPAVATLPFMARITQLWNAEQIAISRSGYTGEDGFEISLPSRIAESLAKELLAMPEVAPIGLGARDSLRLEAGLCLYGHDIDETTNPIEAGLLWSISKRRRVEGGFPADAIIKDVIANGSARRLIGLSIESKTPAREGAEITTQEGEPIGRVTSGGFAPSLGRPVAVGYVTANHAVVGMPLLLWVRGKPIPAEVVSMPFVPHRYYRGVSQ
jgi:aminomethyltransferase